MYLAMGTRTDIANTVAKKNDDTLIGFADADWGGCNRPSVFLRLRFHAEWSYDIVEIAEVTNCITFVNGG